jgi:hypothetical protein
MYLREANIIKTVLVLYQFVRFSEQEILTALRFFDRRTAWAINEKG